MILKAEALSQEQKLVIEQILGRQLLDAEAISLRAFEPRAVTEADRQLAVEKLCEILSEAQRPHTGIADEEIDAALLEAIRKERPRYSPVS